MNGNIIIKNSPQLVTCSGFEAKQGKDMSDLKIINDGTVVIEGGMIKAVGKTGDVLAGFDEGNFNVIDAQGKAVLPGFVDSHTHFVFGGYRAQEFSWRLRGDTAPRRPSVGRPDRPAVERRRGGSPSRPA